MTMMDLFEKYWWLLFPLAGFTFGGFGMWLNYRRSRDMLDIIKTYAAQGKEPPPEVLRALSNRYDGSEWGGDWSGSRHERRAARRAYRWGPYGEIRRVIAFTAMALGFGFAAWWSGGETFRLAFGVVAFVMGAMAVGSLIIAVLQLNNRPDR